MLAENTDQYLESLNAEQRRAVEHGVAAGETIGSPLLVIAGAGSGKTNTLAHRVAHLIIKGADPRRMLLMTFSRRAAAEMTQRVERIARRVLGDKAGIMTDALTWAGTFHGIGARLLREYAESIGYTVKRASNGDEALSYLREGRRFDLLFTDIRMPGATDGWQLAQEARLLLPELRVIYATGLGDAAHGLAEDERYVRKPYSLNELRDALEQLGFEATG